MSILPESLPTDGEGHFTGVSCPDCSGMLVIRAHRSLISFVCRIGHVYSPVELLSAKEELLEMLNAEPAAPLTEGDLP